MDAVDKAAVTKCTHCDDRQRDAADNQTEAVDGIGYGNRLQAAEDGVNRTDNTDGSRRDGNALQFGNLQQTADVENLVEHQSAGVQNRRQVGEQVAEQQQQCDELAQTGIIALFQKFRNRGQTHLEIARNEHKRQKNQRDTGRGLPSHRTHVGRIGLACLSDELFG